MGRPHMDRYSFAAISMFVATIGVDREVFGSVAALRAGSMTSHTQAGEGHLFQANRRYALPQCDADRVPRNSLLLFIRKNLVASYSQYVFDSHSQIPLTIWNNDAFYGSARQKLHDLATLGCG